MFDINKNLDHNAEKGNPKFSIVAVEVWDHSIGREL
jgi:hypothetical protein